MVKITGFTTRDVRFPVSHLLPRIFLCVFANGPMLTPYHQTSLDKTGSDAMNAAGDYSAAYCIIYTDSDYKGHGMVRRECVIPRREINSQSII